MLPLSASDRRLHNAAVQAISRNNRKPTIRQQRRCSAAADRPTRFDANGKELAMTPISLFDYTAQADCMTPAK